MIDPNQLTPPQPLSENRTDYPRNRTIAQLFEEVASKYADSIAVTFGSCNLTYSELNSRANRLANRLRTLGVGPEAMVGCYLDRSIDLIVSLIAILKAGAAYVPFDPSYPEERLEYLLSDSKPLVMLTQGRSAKELPLGATISLNLDNDVPSQPDTNPPPEGGPTNLAYVLYTSGSTGRPKGVLVENRAVVRLVRNTNYCEFSANEVYLQFAPISFDASTFEIWGALLNGARLVIMPPNASSLEDVGRAIREQGVTTLWLTAGLFSLMVEERLEDLQTVRQLLAGGDVLSFQHVRRVLEHLPECRLINGYGPTENTTFTCCHVMDHKGQVSDPVPIGRPISNTQVYILDEKLRPLDPGEIGEIYAAGDGVARGYLNSPELTAERFLPDPFSLESDARMYRTGDRGRWREDGLIEFLGRVDHQVKINGYRIEPGEIEAALRCHTRVKQACIVPVEQNGSRRLHAYYASDSHLSPKELRTFLSQRLPSYMIPGAFTSLARLPLSPNGKVDRTALQAMTISSETPQGAQSPSGFTSMERIIFDVLQRTLQLDRVGPDENFFDLGANSLLLMAVHSELEKVFHKQLPITDLFEFGTVRTLAAHLSGKHSAPSQRLDAKAQAQRQKEAIARQRERRLRGVL